MYVRWRPANCVNGDDSMHMFLELFLWQFKPLWDSHCLLNEIPLNPVRTQIWRNLFCLQGLRYVRLHIIPIFISAPIKWIKSPLNRAVKQRCSGSPSCIYLFFLLMNKSFTGDVQRPWNTALVFPAALLWRTWNNAPYCTPDKYLQLLLLVITHTTCI